MKDLSSDRKLSPDKDDRICIRGSGNQSQNYPNKLRVDTFLHSSQPHSHLNGEYIVLNSYRRTRDMESTNRRDTTTQHQRIEPTSQCVIETVCDFQFMFSKDVVFYFYTRCSSHSSRSPLIAVGNYILFHSILENESKYNDLISLY